MVVLRCVIVKLERVSRTGEVGEIFLGKVRVVVVDKTCVDKAPRPGETFGHAVNRSQDPAIERKLFCVQVCKVCKCVP